ncbi:MAG: hypothetical protein QXI91_05495 [Candidatus Bathyarchaeia archaeon]
MSAIEINGFEYKKVVVSKAFTTERKKPASLSLRRCLNFIYNRVLEGYRDEIPANVFELKFREEIGSDRITFKKYLGSNKRVFLIDGMGKKHPFRGEHEKGDFEKFGLLERIPNPRFPHETLAWKILPYFWIKLKEVYPQRKIAEWFSKQQYERVGEDENISLTHSSERSLQLTAVKEEVSVGETSVSPRTERQQGNISLTERKETVETDSIETNLATTRDKQQTNNNSERDIFYGELTEEELAILTAKPMPKKCVDCGRIDASNPYRVLCPRGKGERSRFDFCVLEGGPNG